MRMPTRFNITQNKNIRKKADRKALSFSNYINLSYVGEGIVHLVFSVDGNDVIFLDDTMLANWLVSECNKFIVGRGVLNKAYKTEVA